MIMGTIKFEGDRIVTKYTENDSEKTDVWLKSNIISDKFIVYNGLRYRLLSSEEI